MFKPKIYTIMSPIWQWKRNIFLIFKKQNSFKSYIEKHQRQNLCRIYFKLINNEWNLKYKYFLLRLRSNNIILIYWLFKYVSMYVLGDLECLIDLFICLFN